MPAKLTLITLTLLAALGSTLLLLVNLDQSFAATLPTPLVTPIRRLFGYCITGKTIYRAGDFFLYNNGCAACLCRPTQGGAYCTLNTANPTCINP